MTKRCHIFYNQCHQKTSPEAISTLKRLTYNSKKFMTQGILRVDEEIVFNFGGFSSFCISWKLYAIFFVIENFTSSNEIKGRSNLCLLQRGYFIFLFAEMEKVVWEWRDFFSAWKFVIAFLHARAHGLYSRQKFSPYFTSFLKNVIVCREARARKYAKVC